MISNETLEEICEKLMTRFANEEEIEAYCERTGRLAYSDDEILIWLLVDWLLLRKSFRGLQIITWIFYLKINIL